MRAIHTEQSALFGGPDGVRDPGLLDAALARPLNKFRYGGGDLAALAAAQAYGIASQHPFVDGNKQSAFAAMIVFLGLNGIALDVPPADATEVMLELAAGDLDEDGLATWLRDHWPKV